MLVLTRRERQSITILDKDNPEYRIDMKIIEITSSGKIILGFRGPHVIKVLRSELLNEHGGDQGEGRAVSLAALAKMPATT